MSDHPDARTPSDHHQDAQDALVEDRAMRPPNAWRVASSSGVAGTQVPGGNPLAVQLRDGPGAEGQQLPGGNPAAPAPTSTTRYRRDFHQEDARERAQEDDDLEEAAQHPFRGWVAAAGAATVFDDRGTDRRCFGRDEADNPSGGSAA